MKKHSIFLSIVVFLMFFLAYAENEGAMGPKTREHLNRIDKTEKELQSNKEKLKELNTTNWKKKIAVSLFGEKDNEENRKTELKNRIGELEKTIASERAKLKTYNKIVLRHVRIESWGAWDLSILGQQKPEIEIEIRQNHRETRINSARGDSSVLDKDFDQDITNCDYLYIYDVDSDSDDKMGEILIKKNLIPLGIAEDSFVIEDNGKIDHDDNGFIYSIKYEVFY